jgi:cell division septation protein DedD
MPEVEVKVIPFAGTKKEKILEKKPQPHPAAVSKTVTVARVKQTTPVKKTTRAVVQLAEKGRVFYYKVLAGSFAKEINARELALRLKEKGFSVFVDRVTVGGQKFFRVQTGAFNQKQEAQNLLGSLKASGFEGAIVIE